ncbi:MAG: hypothetical protein P8Y73_12095, partial [Desulfuromonadales bacterium]
SFGFKILVEAMEQRPDQVGLDQLLAEQPDRLAVWDSLLCKCKSFSRPCVPNTFAKLCVIAGVQARTGLFLEVPISFKRKPTVEV